jgi:hypothetical protein
MSTRPEPAMPNREPGARAPQRPTNPDCPFAAWDQPGRCNYITSVSAIVTCRSSGLRVDLTGSRRRREGPPPSAFLPLQRKMPASGPETGPTDCVSATGNLSRSRFLCKVGYRVIRFDWQNPIRWRVAGGESERRERSAGGGLAATC